MSLYRTVADPLSMGESGTFRDDVAAKSPRRRYDVGPRHAPTNFPEMSQPVKRGAICGLAECPVRHRHGSAGMIQAL